MHQQKKVGLYIIVALIIISILAIFVILFMNFQSPAKIDSTEQIFNPTTISPTNLHLENMNLHQDLPNKFYNTSKVEFIEEGYKVEILAGKLTSFSRCKETRERSQYIYDTTPGEHSSNIVIIITFTPNNWLNETKEKLFFTYLLDIPITKDHFSHSFPIGYEDPRIFMFNYIHPIEKKLNSKETLYKDNGIYIMCNARLNSAMGKSRMFLLYLGTSSDFIALIKPNSHTKSLWPVSAYKLSSSDIDSNFKDEKNWSPWWKDYSLYVTYSIVPHRVLDIPIRNISQIKDNQRINKYYGQLNCNMINKEEIQIPPNLQIKPNYSQIVKKALTKDMSLIRCSTIGLPYESHSFIAFGHIRDGNKYWTFPYVCYYGANKYSISMIGEPRMIIDSQKSIYVSGLSQNPDQHLSYTLHYGIDDCTYDSKTFSRSEIYEWLTSGTDPSIVGSEKLEQVRLNGSSTSLRS